MERLFDIVLIYRGSKISFPDDLLTMERSLPSLSTLTPNVTGLRAQWPIRTSVKLRSEFIDHLAKTSKQQRYLLFN